MLAMFWLEGSIVLMIFSLKNLADVFAASTPCLAERPATKKDSQMSNRKKTSLAELCRGSFVGRFYSL